MAKARIRARAGRRGAARRWRTDQVLVNARRLAFAIIVEGAHPEQVMNIMSWCGLRVPSRQAVYNAMRPICQDICRLARTSMNEAIEAMPDNTVISFDGSWDHRRGGNSCLFSVICSQTGAVIEAMVITKKLTSPSQIFCEKSALMEAAGVHEMITRLMHIPKIVGYVHDDDGKARTLIQRSGWGITEYLDPGHAKKSFLRSLQKFEKDHGKILRAIEGPLEHWMMILIHSEFTVEQKVQLWENTLSHMAGDHTRCIHGPMDGPAWDMAGNELAMDTLKKFLDSTRYIIEKCNALYNTQSNESLNKKKLKYATRDVKWGFTWEARMMCAVLSKNMMNWKNRLYEMQGLDRLPLDAEIRLRQREIQYYGRSVLVRTPEYREERNRQRRERHRRGTTLLRQEAALQYEQNPYNHEENRQ